ncbi:MAG: hypothetical protein HY074_11105 [Deltaproteobacteria bacterium]|nr:hypothetical protein [Deltaproteobacteria bacterium]
MTALGLFIAMAFSAPVARAYVPPSFFMMRMLGRKHANFDDGRFRNKLTFYKKNGEIAFVLTESLVLSDAEHASIKLINSAGNEVASHTRKLLGTRPGDTDRPVPYDLIFIKDGANIYEHFHALGLPLKTEGALYSEKEGAMPYKPESGVALERYDNRIAVVIGDRTKKLDAYASTALWIEKESYLPMRAVFPTAPEMGMASEALEFRFSAYGVYKNFLYPRNVQVLRGGLLWAKIETQDLRPFGSAGKGEDEGRKKEEPDGDLREFIETYFKWIR